VLGEVSPPDPEAHARLQGLLEGGEYDFSKLPAWVRRFEVRVGALERCLEYVRGGGLSYCRDGFVVVFGEGNQIVGVARRRAGVRIEGGSVGFDFSYEGYARLPRFMGILHHGGTNVLLVVRDGVVDDAWVLEKPTPFVITRILSRGLREPFWCLRSSYLAGLLFSAIPRVGLGRLPRGERVGLVNQLRALGVHVPV